MNNTYGIEKWGILNPLAVYRNLSPAELTELALETEDSKLMDNGALLVTTGKYTGRSPHDRFIVDEPSVTDEIDWGSINKKISVDNFDRILAKVTAYLSNREIFIFDGFVGADPKHRISLRVINEYASQNLFMYNMLIRPTPKDLERFEEDFTILCAPGLKLVPEDDGVNSEAGIILSFEKKVILIAGSKYAGEMKKSVFSLMNYLLPKKGILSMHCSANVSPQDGSSALFFGLSGTGKTTLSADPQRGLIGDDEHGWSDEGIFNFEGGCYAKCIGLSEEKEPEIYRAVRFGALVENVIVDQDRRPDYDDASITENTRVSYPIEYIPNAVIPSVASHPKTIIFLTADSFGVLPPVAKLTKEQAMYYFISGYTSKLAGTERGIIEPQSTFSTCFGAAFLPLRTNLYADLLGQKIEKHGSDVFLINTGWSGGAYGVGSRMSLKVTRSIVTATLNGDLSNAEYEQEPYFGLYIPKSCPGVDAKLLNPINTWEDKDAYIKTAKKLAYDFVKNFEQYADIDPKIKNAGPKV
ncbi:MAG TPA: phosphoenolpyruvate carboxykinase (ATP) [Clostridiales bacterium]|nr:phosphoenolpyruvate carboxykinase (ATP) [Clostridiales bacterium]